MSRVPTFADVQAAVVRLSGNAVKTPLLRADMIDDRVMHSNIGGLSTVYRP